MLPENILISTFTDAGVVAIKKRLNDFIGSASYKVEISTLHGLANTIITNYPDFFVKYRALVQMDELETYEMIEDILESGEYLALRPIYTPGFWIRNIANSLQKLREE